MPNEAVVASAMNNAPGQWTRTEISERLDAIWHLLASSGEGTLPGKLDTDLHQKLAHSQHPLATIEQRLGQLAGAGVFEFTEAAYHDGTRATALTAGYGTDERRDAPVSHGGFNKSGHERQ